ncbi:hypothetical protein [Solimonas variicoloris]|uniref:hypothetical protein n=1 Tax=Solimonas variicoloris TaxID=254408 RepID=UPI001FDF4FEC|nr:hypothetical protein [Solimonas variicoloris]
MRTPLASLMMAAALLLGAQTVHAADTLRPEVGEPLQKAQTLIQGKKYKDALQQVDAAAKVGSLTPYESYIVERMRAAAATGAGDTNTAIKAYETVLASPQMPAGEKTQTYDVVAKLAYAGRNYGKAAEYIQKYRSAGGNSAQTLGLLPQVLYQAGDLAGAQRELNAQIGALEKAGQKPTETQLQLLAQLGLKQNNQAAYTAALEKLVTYYPKRDYWLDVIIRTSNKPGFSDRLTLDLYRVKKMTGTLEKGSDFMEAAQLALQAGFPGEADQYVKLGYDKKVLGAGSDAERHKRLKDLVAKKIAENKPALAEAEKQAATEADGEALIKAGLNRVGYGEYAAGIALIQQGIKKDALKKPDEAKLHLGYAQLLGGKTDDALKTLKTVQGKDGSADLARLYSLTARK